MDWPLPEAVRKGEIWQNPPTPQKRPNPTPLTPSKIQRSPVGIPGQITALAASGLRELRVSKSESLKQRSGKSHFSICHIKEKGEHANWLVIFSLDNRWPLSHGSRQSGRCCLPASSLGPTRSGLREAPSFCLLLLHPGLVLVPSLQRSEKNLLFLSRSLSHDPEQVHVGPWGAHGAPSLGRDSEDGREHGTLELGPWRGCPGAVGTQERRLT